MSVLILKIGLFAPVMYDIILLSSKQEEIVMTNLDIIKEDLCRQIMSSSPEQLKSIVDIVEEGYENLAWIDISKMLTCDKCRVKYGCNTEDSLQECIDNFKTFCDEDL